VFKPDGLTPGIAKFAKAAFQRIKLGLFVAGISGVPQHATTRRPF
jgi:hypothetical protein